MFLRSWHATILSQAFLRTRTLLMAELWLCGQLLIPGLPECASCLFDQPTETLCCFILKLFRLMHVWVGAWYPFTLFEHFFLCHVAWIIRVAFLGLKWMTVMLSKVSPLCLAQNSVSQHYTLLGISFQFWTSEPFLTSLLGLTEFWPSHVQPSFFQGLMRIPDTYFFVSVH